MLRQTELKGLFEEEFKGQKARRFYHLCSGCKSPVEGTQNQDSFYCPRCRKTNVTRLPSRPRTP